MRDPFALAVMLIGTAVMAYGFVLLAMTQLGARTGLWWDIALVIGGLFAASVGGYAVGRSVAEPGAWDEAA